jgi:hypothetical protein
VELWVPVAVPDGPLVQPSMMEVLGSTASDKQAISHRP